MALFAGIDVGASTTKALIIDEGHNVLGYDVVDSGADFAGAAEKVFEGSRAGIRGSGPGDFVAVSTGYGRRNVPFSHASKTEISCHAKGSFFHYFKSKEHLFFALDSRAGQMLRERFLEAYETVELGLDKIREIGRAYFKFSFDFPNYFKAMNYVQRMNPETFH